MKMSYAYCVCCGREWLDGVFLSFFGKYANGDFYECPECGDSIGPGNYEIEGKEETE